MCLEPGHNPSGSVSKWCHHAYWKRREGEERRSDGLELNYSMFSLYSTSANGVCYLFVHGKICYHSSFLCTFNLQVKVTNPLHKTFILHAFYLLASYLVCTCTRLVCWLLIQRRHLSKSKSTYDPVEFYYSYSFDIILYWNPESEEDNCMSMCVTTESLLVSGGGPLSDFSLRLLHGPESGQPFLCGHQWSGEIWHSWCWWRCSVYHWPGHMLY